MPEGTYLFPDGFLWGSATASHQVEGNNKNNNWYAWETQQGKIYQDQKAGLACDWWGGKWKDDFDRASATGQNAHRLSIEWSRIQPEQSRWDESALETYRSMLRGLIDRNMTPMVTLHHFTDPLWIMEKGGWENEEIVSLFETYIIKVVEALKEYVTLWVTINEPNVYTHGGYLGGEFPPGKNDLKAAFFVMRNMLKGHAAAYHAIKKIQPQARVGLAHHYRGFEPAKPNFAPDKWMASFLSRNFNDSFAIGAANGKFNFAMRKEYIPQAINTQDFIGLNYYTREYITFKPFATKSMFYQGKYDPKSPLSETGFIALEPKGFYQALKWCKAFNKPIIITENGVEDSKNMIRTRYLYEHLHQMWRAINYTWPIKGYFHWSLVDNFEWERGWSQRFGLWGLDVETQTRLHRPAVDAYADLCKTNGISSESVKKYAPEIFDLLFPE
ncbi:MAG: glycoside hydrolase family 1 protein [Anaerolineaceae bacterium]|nr:glycoside hydrolase family 1 protein [Anaerolineaceae bacterium]